MREGLLRRRAVVLVVLGGERSQMAALMVGVPARAPRWKRIAGRAGEEGRGEVEA